jgi:hypothetical protein
MAPSKYYGMESSCTRDQTECHPLFVPNPWKHFDTRLKTVQPPRGLPCPELNAASKGETDRQGKAWTLSCLIG